MGETADHAEKNDGATKVEKEKHEKKEKHTDVDGKEEGKGEKKVKDKKKKDKEGKDKEGGDGKEKKKNPEDKTDPAKLKLKLEKFDAKMQAMAVKREEILKMISEAEKKAANPSGGSATPQVAP